MRYLSSSKTRLLVCIVAALLFGVTTVSAEGHNYRLQVVNTLQSEVAYLFLSPVQSDYWGVDVLGGTTEFKSVITSETSVEFTAVGPDDLSLDILAIDAAGRIFEQRNVQVSADRMEILSIRAEQEFDQGVDTNVALRPLRVENRLGTRLDAFFTGPGDTRDFSVNMLHTEADSWEANQSFVFWYFYGWDQPLFFRAESAAGSRDEVILLEDDEGLLVLE
ncbi:hypothetical protein [Spirochaeta africana]|uniref:Uncharacterized protein n=1 Tax=Spirochaeta africana (strain ATCC 700263 / DSM 8902 / Z-7692) TaxID=889378 RepID=H9UHC1_SPIAZ|nr:hypothetical protein [Spirochaeta africana]AFG36914.1 hypothetical protein Spiaf_0820 [Spirochaeta africana DSM 8902]